MKDVRANFFQDMGDEHWIDIHAASQQGDCRQLVRQLVVQAVVDLLARDLGCKRAQRYIRQVIGGVVPGPGRNARS